MTRIAMVRATSIALALGALVGPALAPPGAYASHAVIPRASAFRASNLRASTFQTSPPRESTLQASPPRDSTFQPSLTGAFAPGAFALRHSLLSSRELWATIDVCNPADQPDMVGVRGSMPGDGHVHDAMYMRFQLQYLNTKSNVWSTPAKGADSGFVSVGMSRAPRQGGSSFQLSAPAGKPGYTLRGIVTFEWRRAGRVVHQATRTTSAGHQGVADADPREYSAAECTIA